MAVVLLATVAAHPAVPLCNLNGDWSNGKGPESHIQFFQNEGEAIRRRVRLGGVEMNLVVAADLRGDLLRSEGAVRLTFDAGHSVRLSKLLIRARLHSLGVFHDHIDVDLRGGAGLRIDLV